MDVPTATRGGVAQQELDQANSSLSGPSYTMVLPDNRPEGAVYTDSVQWYNEQIKLWESYLAKNEEAKVKSIENPADYLQTNLTFDGGSQVTNTIEETSSSETYVHNTFNVQASFAMKHVTENKTGVSVYNVTLEHEQNTGAGGVLTDSRKQEFVSSFQYVLAEEGLDALTVDVFKGADIFSPIFVTRGGRTKNPYEGREVTQYYRKGTCISEATAQIEMPNISVANPFATGIPAGESAVFTLELSNTSETSQNLWYDLVADLSSNPNGAILEVDGMPITGPMRVYILQGQTLKKTLTLKQSDPSVLDYTDIRIRLMSPYQNDPGSVHPPIYDEVTLEAHFTPSCSDIALRIPKRTLNTSAGLPVLDVEVADFNRLYRSFLGFELQYKYEKDPDWRLYRTYYLDPQDGRIDNVNILPLPADDVVKIPVDMSGDIFPDGNYVFRAVTLCQFGDMVINNESAEVAVVKDLRRPEILGTPNPADGLLEPGDDIFAIFNEDIRSAVLNQRNNFVVTGALASATTTHHVALQSTGQDAFAASTQANLPLNGTDFAADFWLWADASGTILRHGTAQHCFALSLLPDSTLELSVGQSTYRSTQRLPMHCWTFVSLTMDDNVASGISQFDAQAAVDDQTISLFQDVMVKRHTGEGRLWLCGQGFEGKIHHMSLWNRTRPLSESQSEMYQSKSAQTYGLIGYWPIDEALAGALPQTGDMVKSQTEFAVYEGYQWVGSLTTLRAGEGYMYRSLAEGEKAFTYPQPTAATALRTRQMATRSGGGEPVWFQPVDFHAFEHNMNIYAQLRTSLDGEPLADVEVGAFVDDECRGVTLSDADANIFLTIFADEYASVTLMAVIDDQIYEAETPIDFVPDALLGRPGAPFILYALPSGEAAPAPSSQHIVLRSANATGLDKGKTTGTPQPIYSLDGTFRGTNPSHLPDGVYVIAGRKVLLRAGHPIAQPQ